MEQHLIAVVEHSYWEGVFLFDTVLTFLVGFERTLSVHPTFIEKEWDIFNLELTLNKFGLVYQFSNHSTVAKLNDQPPY